MTPSSRCSITLAAVLAGVMASAPHLGAQAKPAPPAGAERVFAESPNVWFEEYFRASQVAPDGRFATWSGGPPPARILDVGRGTEARGRVWAGVDQVVFAAFDSRSELALVGTSGGKSGWFMRDKGHPQLLAMPPDAMPQWSPDGRGVAFSRRRAPDSLYAGPLGGAHAYHIDGAVTGFAWMPSGGSLIVCSAIPDGSSMLTRVDVATGTETVVARGLDAPPSHSSPVAVAPDGRRAFVALASAGAPQPEARHEPRAPRTLAIYEVDLATGARRVVVPAPDGGEVFAPSVASGHLYWTSAATEQSVVVLAAAGGDVTVVMKGAMVPSWRPDGRQLGFSYGNWRLADWAINWDGGAVDVDAAGHASGALIPVVTGYHEDFQPVWAPRGHWLAYHSHRSPAPVSSYGAPGSTDDIWLKPVGAPAKYGREIRLTDYGSEAGSPDWSRDGRRLVFASFEQGGKPGVSYPFVVTIDTATGRVVQHGRLPLPSQVHNAVWASWSPASDSLALEEDLGTGRHALWIAASDGSGARKVTEYAMTTYGGVSWTPDAKRLVYAALAGAGNRMQLFDIPVAGGTPRQLTHDSANVFLPSVSPNGKLIAATRILHRKEIWRMALVSR